MAKLKDRFWKMIADNFFEELIAFFFPKFYADIDWSKPVKFVDKELDKLTPQGQDKPREADKVAEVWWKTGGQKAILLHLELQSYHDKEFAERLYIYNYRLQDSLKMPVVTLAVLTDPVAKDVVTQYKFELHDFKKQMDVPTVKVWEYADRTAELEQNPNPMALVVLAQVRFLANKKDPNQLYVSKISIIRLLLERGYDREKIRPLFWFIDWVISLPEELKEQFKQEVSELGGGKNMEEPLSPTTVLRMEKAIEHEEKEWVLSFLDWRFGNLEQQVRKQILSLTPGQAYQLRKDAFTFSSKDDLSDWLANPPKVEKPSPFAEYWAEYHEDAYERLNNDYEVVDGDAENKKE